MKLRSLLLLGIIVSLLRTPTVLAAIPTLTPQLTSVPPAHDTVLSLSVLLHGVGRGGDNANPSSVGNVTPVHSQRTTTLYVYNQLGQLVIQQEGLITYSQGTGAFSGTIDLGPGFTAGTYTLKIQTPGYLRRQIGGLQSVVSNVKNTLPQVTLVAGDTNTDNKLNILDYNTLIKCFKSATRALCTPQLQTTSDINDDGNINGVDYNIFLREFWIQTGQ